MKVIPETRRQVTLANFGNLFKPFVSDEGYSRTRALDYVSTFYYYHNVDISDVSILGTRRAH
jgi:hypothetical protein